MEEVPAEDKEGNTRDSDRRRVGLIGCLINSNLNYKDQQCNVQWLVFNTFILKCLRLLPFMHGCHVHVYEYLSCGL